MRRERNREARRHPGASILRARCVSRGARDAPPSRRGRAMHRTRRTIGSNDGQRTIALQFPQASVRGLAWLLALLLALIAAGAAHPAAVHGQTTASSSAFGESVNVHLDPLLGATVDVVSGPAPLASGTAAPPYNQTQ